MNKAVSERASSDRFSEPSVSVIVPCLNEEASIDACLAEIAQAERALGEPLEVIVVDNGSTDRSADVVSSGLKRFRYGKLVREPRRGYGMAYRAGFEHIRTPYVFMADGDGSYDFKEIPRFVSELKSGRDVILGDRFSGSMRRDAMPFMHRYVGNPVLSGMLRLLFRGRVHDAHSGMRAFKASLLDAVRFEASGMEFASEMIVVLAESGASIHELPIEYRPRTGDSKLRPFRDGLRHVRFMLGRRLRKI